MSQDETMIAHGDQYATLGDQRLGPEVGEPSSRALAIASAAASVVTASASACSKISVSVAPMPATRDRRVAASQPSSSTPIRCSAPPELITKSGAYRMPAA